MMQNCRTKNVKGGIGVELVMEDGGWIQEAWEEELRNVWDAGQRKKKNFEVVWWSEQKKKKKNDRDEWQKEDELKLRVETGVVKASVNGRELNNQLVDRMWWM